MGRPSRLRGRAAAWFGAQALQRRLMTRPQVQAGQRSIDGYASLLHGMQVREQLGAAGQGKRGKTTRHDRTRYGLQRSG